MATWERETAWSLVFMNNLTGDLPPLLTPRELADFLRISQVSIYRLVDKRALSFIKVGGSLRFPRENVEAYLEHNRVESFSGLQKSL